MATTPFCNRSEVKVAVHTVDSFQGSEAGGFFSVSCDESLLVASWDFLKLTNFCKEIETKYGLGFL